MSSRTAFLFDQTNWDHLFKTNEDEVNLKINNLFNLKGTTRNTSSNVVAPSMTFACTAIRSGSTPSFLDCAFRSFSVP